MSISVKKISVTIGNSSSNGFDIELNGVTWHLDNFTLSQTLLSYNILAFDMHKGPEEDADETQFAVCSQLIGKKIALSLDTDNIEKLSLDLSSDNEKTDEICFKGIILSASGSRMGSQYTVEVEARSWEALLDDNPNCKSFEGMNLNDIINDVVKDYNKNIQATIDARFTDSIPYCVQYNETNYQFLQRLARRYGEWLYNDGEQMVFGNLVSSDDEVELNYPSQDIPSYNVELKMQHVAFSHLTSSYNAYDFTAKEGLEEKQEPYNKLNKSVFEASQNSFSKPTLQNLHSGGFADEDGRDAILNISTKTQILGEQANMLTYSGNTYCSKLKIGSAFSIVDNYISDSYSNEKNNGRKHSILVTELIHSFSADETYSNHFVGIPSACDYPPYANSDVYPIAPSCRARVTDNEDPMDWGRIRVQFDWQARLDENMKTPWLRIAQPYAGGGKGFSFIPEIGEEVMVDFEGGNAERPYVKGTLYNGVGNPDAEWLPQKYSSNQVKAIRTRNGHTIEIHDKDEGGYIRIYDNEKENYILTFSTDEKLIKLYSKGNIELHALNDIVMHAEHNIEVTADNDMNVTVKHNRTLMVDNDDSNTVQNNQTVSVGNDQTSNIGNNQTIEVSEDQSVNVAGNSDVSVGKQASLKAKDIEVDASMTLSTVSKTHKQKADGDMSINSGSDMNIKAKTVKIN